MLVSRCSAGEVVVLHTGNGVSSAAGGTYCGIGTADCCGSCAIVITLARSMVRLTAAELQCQQVKRWLWLKVGGKSAAEALANQILDSRYTQPLEHFAVSI